MFCLTAAGLLGYRFFGMDTYGNPHSASASASLCTNYLSVVFNMFEKYATADPTQYAAGVRAFARILEFLCQSSSSDGCRGTFWVWCLTQLCLSPLSSTVLPLTVMCTEITRALIVDGRHLSDPFERAMCTILENRGVTVGDVMRFCNAFTLREDEVASLMGLFEVGVVTKLRYGADDVIALQRKMLLPNATRRVMPVGLDLLAAYLGRIMPAAGLAEHSTSRLKSNRRAVTVFVTSAAVAALCSRCIQATDRHWRHRGAANHSLKCVSDAACLRRALHDGRQTCRAERDSRRAHFLARTQVHALDASGVAAVNLSATT